MTSPELVRVLVEALEDAADQFSVIDGFYLSLTNRSLELATNAERDARAALALAQDQGVSHEGVGL